MQGLVALMVENGDIAESVDISPFINTTYLEDAAAMGCGQ